MCAACVETTCTFALEVGDPAMLPVDPNTGRRLMQEGAQQCCQTCQCENPDAEPTKTCNAAVEGDECDDTGAQTSILCTFTAHIACVGDMHGGGIWEKLS